MPLDDYVREARVTGEGKAREDKGTVSEAGDHAGREAGRQTRR